MRRCCSGPVYALEYCDVAGEFRWETAEKLSRVTIFDQMDNDARRGKNSMTSTYY